MRRRLRQRGFTLIEMLLYIGIFSIFMLTLTAFLQAVLADRVKSQLIDNTNEEAASAMLTMVQSTRNATGITSPVLGARAASTTLAVASSTNSPTAFSLSSGGQLLMTEGAGAPVPLTSPRVVVSNLSFSNVGRTGTDGSLIVSFTVTATTTSSRQEFTYSHAFEDAATIRN